MSQGLHTRVHIGRMAPIQRVHRRLPPGPPLQLDREPAFVALLARVAAIIVGRPRC